MNAGREIGTRKSPCAYESAILIHPFISRVCFTAVIYLFFVDIFPFYQDWALEFFYNPESICKTGPCRAQTATDIAPYQWPAQSFVPIEHIMASISK
jgi:hypothetical protein